MNVVTLFVEGHPFGIWEETRYAVNTSRPFIILCSMSAHRNNNIPGMLLLIVLNLVL